MNDSLRILLERHEGLSLTLYTDTVGKATIGYGRNLADGGISQGEADIMLANDATIAIARVRVIFPEYDSWSVPRQDALVDMMFNIGPGNFAGFHNMINAVHLGDWATAAAAMLDSEWARQVPTRVAEDSSMLEVG